MEKLIVKIVNAETGIEVEREMNAAEYKQHEIDQKVRLDVIELANAVAIKKAALLERLGMTADEAALLLS